MQSKINKREIDYKGQQLWLNPVDKTVYATVGAPTYSFGEVNGTPIYNYNAHFDAVKTAKDKLGTSYFHDAFVDPEFRSLAEDYVSDIKSGGRQRQAALRSNVNSAVDIVNVWETVLGKRDRVYAGKNLAKEIAVPNLLISIDTVTKYTGMEKLDEGMRARVKELPYTRANFTAAKYGLKFIIHEEARLKNVHNVLQDSIQVASTKIEQRQSFDVLAITESNTAQAAGGLWDTFTTNTDHSINDPTIDIGIASLNIEGSGVGGKLNRVGMHQLTFAKYTGNTFLRGVASNGPRDYNYEPGTSDLVGIPGIGLVLDNGIKQGDVHCVDTELEPNCALFQGPQRVGSMHDEETGDDKYFVIDYHLAAKIQSETGRLITGAITPLAW